MQRARLVLRTPRQNRFKMVQEFVGANWSEEGAVKKVPCNLIAQYCSIVGRKLIAHNPRVMLSTWSKRARPAIAAMQDWANKSIEKMCLADTLQECVLDAMFNIGICKVALATPGDAALMGWRLKAGTPFAEAIDLDDWVYDVHCKKLREAGFMGHRYRVPLSVVKSDKMFSKDRSKLTATSDQIYNLEGDERIGLIGRTTLGGDQEEFEDYIDLWEVYLPRHKVVLTLRDDQLTGASMEGDATKVFGYGRALRVQKWLGPECGPYHILGFSKVPGNPMPKAPVQDLYDLHMGINNILRKLLREAHDYKSWTAVQGGASEDASRILTVNDGEIIKVDNPDKIVKMESGGPNQQLYVLFEGLRGLYSWLAGNLDVMGGLRSDSDTATQEKLLNQNSSATVDEMQQRTVDFTSSICSALTWYWHHHPTQVMKSEYQAPGMQGMSVPRRVFPQGQGTNPMGKKRLARDHDYEDMDIRVDPYSMPHITPAQRLQMMQGLVTQTYLPMAQIAQQQGISLDLNAFFDKWGKYADMPDVKDLLTIGDPPPTEGAGSPNGEAGPSAGKPPETTRNYTRRSKGQGGEQNSLIQAMQQAGGQNGTVQSGGQGPMPRTR